MHVPSSIRTQYGKITALFAASLVLYYFQILPASRNLPSQITTSMSENRQLPNKIWYKLGPRGLTEETRNWTQTCIDLNPEAEHEFMTDALGDEWVARVYADNATIVQTYLNLTIPILKADFLRYLLLFADGGVYLDLDVTCHVPIKDWVPEEYRSNASLVVGWEFDVGWGEAIIREFATWTIISKPRSPHLWSLVMDIMDFFEAKRLEVGVDSVAELTLAMVGDIVDATGPRRFTRSILTSLGKSMEGEEPVDVNTIKNLREPNLVEDVLILPGFSFAAESNHWPPDWTLTPPLVTHHGLGSWKNEHGGEQHGSVTSK
ncbi:hypothetical protein N0V82_002946 [Gnomoniopsis sp. IMI 355080]|nr:hypothetical protein N0V82_002946 [Gnomoniopsis sp. IMI 355080]